MFKQFRCYLDMVVSRWEPSQSFSCKTFHSLDGYRLDLHFGFTVTFWALLNWVSLSCLLLSHFKTTSKMIKHTKKQSFRHLQSPHVIQRTRMHERDTEKEKQNGRKGPRVMGMIMYASCRAGSSSSVGMKPFRKSLLFQNSFETLQKSSP